MDYMVVGISPVLIMAMVGSLLFYLLTVFYHGQYEFRLAFIFAMFVMAIVLIARISMEEGIEYAALFAVPLAIVTLLALMRFVHIQGRLAPYSTMINAGLMALVWWSAHRLTWDCTLIDENQDSSGEGLLQGMGFTQETVQNQAAEQANGLAEESDERGGAAADGAAEESSRPGWWRRLMDRRRRAHAPGIWVVYFAVAALPLFALGQWLIPADDVASRRHAFQLLILYVASAMGLLLTCSFLGLRRYLRQRKMEMPLDMAGVWLGMGAIMILALLLFCMLLPRPGATVSVSQLPFKFTSSEPSRTNRHAIGNDGPERPQKATRTRPDAKQPGKGADARNHRDGQPPGAAESASAKSANGEATGDHGRPEGSKAGRSGESTRAEGSRNGSAERNGAKRNGSSSRRNQESKTATDASGRPSPGSKSEGKQRPASRDSSKQPGTESGEPVSDPSSTESWNVIDAVTGFLGGLSGLLKALFWLALILVGAYFAWKYRAELLEAVRQLVAELKQLWTRLFGGRRQDDEEADLPTGSRASVYKPFASYRNPFSSGGAERYSTEQLICYTFEALEAWAREHACPRDEDRTPLEFARHVATEHPSLGIKAQQLADLYSRVAYGRERIPADDRNVLKPLWRDMLASAAMPPPPPSNSS